MKRVIPYWEKGGEWTQQGLFIKRVGSSLPVEATEIARCSLPYFSFLFLLEGEILADVDGEQCLCRGGQLLMVPANVPFSVHHFTGIIGYTGGFSPSSLRDMSYPFLTSGKPVMRTYWFDSATFIAQIMDRMVAAFARGDTGYLIRAFDLFLYSIPSPGEAKAHPVVNRFFDMSPSYLNKLVRTQTRHSAMDWVEISRVNWAKSLLKDSDLSIGEVSVAIGVDDPSYFTRFFRKSTGMTPSEFRHRTSRRPKEDKK